MLIKQKSPLLPRNFALVTSGELLIVFSKKVNLLYLLYSMGQWCCLLHLIKQNCFAENFSLNSNLDDSHISSPVFLFRTNLKLHNISVTPNMVRKVVMNLDLSKASGLDCIPVVVKKNCEPELSYILAELFNKCLEESCFPDCWKVLSVVAVFKFLKAPFLVLHISYYTLMTFLMMLSVILPSMLMILLSILSVIRHLICGNNLN